ncbi:MULTISPECIES: MarR family winged helix-turn-helix transcriptional regulator [Paenibacillus]|uniref:MarR family transcriptional regulator n=1 Tax=Paenibacillus albilobatus TaxID=2716884 RepID=A0A920CA70_9BACL|nr:MULTISPECIES: MarR family transcriptional regulator [Paenibacillus]GIO32066.1 MarR family transcriptional regulator [Paenibacillus albilobatus]
MRGREGTTFSNLFQMIGLKLKRKADESIQELGLNAQQGRMISYIAQHQDKGLIQKDLAQAFQRREASITSMLQGLEKKGYVERKIPADNERQKNIYVLPKGEELIDAFEGAFANVENEIIQALSAEEQETLLKLLSKINQRLG